MTALTTGLLLLLVFLDSRSACRFERVSPVSVDDRRSAEMQDGR
ncbi:MAG: hypothetical protein U0S48_11925 [Solirubrobacteraceae bacterium]